MQKEEAIGGCPWGPPKRSHPLPGPHLGPKCSWQRLPGQGTAIQVLLGTVGLILQGFLCSRELRLARRVGSRRAQKAWGSPEAEGGCGISAQPGHEPGPPKAEIRSATRVCGGPVTPRKGPPKFKQRQARQFKSRSPQEGVQG